MSDDNTAEIQRRAYLIWERENRPEGKHLEHWLCAEAEVEAGLSLRHAVTASIPRWRRLIGLGSIAIARRRSLQV